jgi:hypothetical protein
MPSTLRSRLQRLRLQKVKQQLPPSVPPRVLAERVELKHLEQQAAAERAELPGREVVTPQGAFQLIENRYALDFAHGPLPLANLLTRDPAVAAQLARDDTLAAARLQDLAFLDTETTGLAGGAGTLAFLVGVGVFEDDAYVLRQYFLRGPAEEPAMLAALLADLALRAGWITFNGKAFDLPLLDTRLVMNRLRTRLSPRPHLDLLMPARRLYRGRLASCSLGHLEQHVFHIIREQDDVPGALIPGMYLDYLRSGDARDMRRVIYHNTIDILSMVTLAAHLLDVFSTPIPQSSVRSPKSEVKDSRPRTSDLGPADLVRLAKWHHDNHRLAEAEAAYRRALAAQLELADRREGLTRLAALLKAQARRAEAAPLWEQLAAFTVDDPIPFVELAKHHEWQTLDFDRALEWTQRAQKVVAALPRGWRRDEAAQALKHRLERLKLKQRAARK